MANNKEERRSVRGVTVSKKVADDAAATLDFFEGLKRLMVAGPSAIEALRDILKGEKLLTPEFTAALDSMKTATVTELAKRQAAQFGPPSK